MSSATGRKGKPPDMSEEDLLAPWYVTGKLNEAEARELEALAKEDPEFAALLAEAGREQQATAAVNEGLGKPSPAVWQRLERSIEQVSREEARAQRAGFFEGIKTTVSGFFAGLTMPQWQAIAAAAIAVCVIQAGAIAYFVQERQPAKYGTASGPASSAALKPAFIVSFSQTATMADINALLDDAGASIVEGPSADALYHLALPQDTVEMKEIAYKKLRASPAVKLILREK
jgi:anti-sigma factor RsiW